MISVVLNLDSRPGVDGAVSEFSHHNEGTRSWDFMLHGPAMIRRFFAGFDIELIAYVDESVPIPSEIVEHLRVEADCLIIRKHFTGYRNLEPCAWANDIRYLHALFQARGEIVCHFDADTVAVAKDGGAVQSLLDLLNEFRFVCYPALWSPRAAKDDTFGKHTWASTRFFLCRREHLQFDVLEHALREPEWAYQQFGCPRRKLPWLEHFLALTNEESALYPPRRDDSLMVFCWRVYHSGVLEKLNAMPYNDIRNLVESWGGIGYPNDVSSQPL